jgi:hypothetical protein
MWLLAHQYLSTLVFNYVTNLIGNQCTFGTVLEKKITPTQ